MSLIQNKYGFTLIELLIVVALIGILSMTVMWVYQTSILRAKNGKAQADLNRIGKAIRQMEVDTERWPMHLATYTGCGTNSATTHEFELDSSGAVGLLQTDGAYSGWNGPYLAELPTDPWGKPYRFDNDYFCFQDSVTRGIGCEWETDPLNTVSVIFSSGPNRSGGTYDEDNIVLLLCPSN